MQQCLWYGSEKDCKKYSKFSGGHSNYFISIGDPGSLPPPTFYEFLPSARLRLEFFDFDNDILGAPTRKDIGTLIAFVKSRNTSHSFQNYLIHCKAGISRSSAAALIIEGLKGKEYLDLAIQNFLSTKVEIHPNFKMLKIADEITNNEFQFIEHYLKYEKQFIASYRKTFTYEDIYGRNKRKSIKTF
jgi:predicted protein tyrosine phosphatase